MKVEFVYRNYKPIYPHYLSLVHDAREGIEPIYPKVKNLRKLFTLYRKYGNLPGVREGVAIGQRLLFREKPESQSDLRYYIGMLPKRLESGPFVVDIEHINALLNFTSETYFIREAILNSLSHTNCKAVLPWSEAAQKTLALFLGDQYHEISSKVKVIYPAVQRQEKRANFENTDQTFKMLFVGKDGIRKGLKQLLAAVELLSQDYPQVRLDVISNTPLELCRKYSHLESVRFLPPNFSRDELIKNFFLKSHLFVMPTLADTFGMVFLEALSCGLPVMCTRQFSSPEIVEDGSDGILLSNEQLFLDRSVMPERLAESDYQLDDDENNRIVNSLVENITRLIDNPSILRSMSQCAPKKFEKGGKFSIEKRNDELIKVFERI